MKVGTCRKLIDHIKELIIEGQDHFFKLKSSISTMPIKLFVNGFRRLVPSQGLYLFFCNDNKNTAAFTYYYDPAIWQNNLTPLSIFRDLALRKGDSKKLRFYFYVFYRVYTNIPKLFGLVVYYFTAFLGDSVACARFGTKNSVKF